MSEHEAPSNGQPSPDQTRTELDPERWRDLWRQALWQIRRLGADEADAEDIAQETMARLVVAHADVENPNAWVRTVARRLFLDQQRRRGTRQRTLFQAEKRIREPESPSGEWRAVVDIGRILSTMPERSRKLLTLYSLGYTRGEIAERLECESHQVGPRTRRALETARRRVVRRFGE